ncbi:MAG: substrate-binding domain-containing protein [Planctomycetota bacterium]|nr:substrate-binding domain-containing protein [Planctomycetota bacterium]
MSRYLLITFVALSANLLIGCGGSPGGSGNGDTKTGDAPGIIMLRYTTGSESTGQRERGFIETIKKEYPEINVLSSDQYAQTTMDSSVTKATDMLTKYGDRVQGIFAVCEPNAHGTLNALEEKKMTGKVKFVGFDPNSTMVTAMGEKKMEGIVLQDPVQMGYLAVKTMVDHLEGKKVEKRISTGEYVATPENMNSERMKALLAPQQTDSSPEVKDAKYRIAVIPKGTTHEFWKSIHFGASKAAKELGNVQVIYRGPSKEGNTESQINLVQDMIAQEVDGICLAPNDSSALVTPVEESGKKGIPVVIFDSGLQGSKDNYVSYVATDNYNGGVLAAHCLAKSLGHTKKEKPAEKADQDKK